MAGIRNKNVIDGDIYVSGTVHAAGINSADVTKVVTKIAATDLAVSQVQAHSDTVDLDLAEFELDLIRASVILSSSVASVKRSRVGVYSPTTITFTSSLPDGTLYPCRFIIRESTDGTSFSTVYTSSSNESSHVHTPSVTAVTIRCMIYLYAV